MHLTANEYIALPEIGDNADIKSMNVLSMQRRGMIEFRAKENPVFHSRFALNAIEIVLSPRSLDRYWIPCFGAQRDGVSIEATILSPRGHKGFVQSIRITNESAVPCKFDLFLHACIREVLHTVNESKVFSGSMHLYQSSWSNSPCFDIRSSFPELSLAVESASEGSWTYVHEDGLSSEFSSVAIIEPNEEKTYQFFWGVGYEEVAAVTAARQMLREGYERLYNNTCSYLDSLIRPTSDHVFDQRLYRNLLFCIHFSTGYTIDTEQLVLVTSRSPRYYVSAAYWDRDTLLWAFPAILEVDTKLARQMLGYVATIQKRNIGIHSRYIDGTILEAGFELDELCCPILAIEAYREKTGENILDDREIQSLVNLIIEKLFVVKNKTGLFETFLQPTDDMHVYPFLTYGNALVYRVFSILSSWNYNQEGLKWAMEQENVKQAIFTHLVKDGSHGKQFAWSCDGKISYDIYDEPPGSLLLLPLFGLVSFDDPIYINTVKTITDKSYAYAFVDTPYAAIGCPHAPHPWILSLANQLRVSHDEQALYKLLHAPMDEGIACESIDEYTGVVATGEAFATCAGYLAYVLIEELKRRGTWNLS